MQAWRFSVPGTLVILGCSLLAESDLWADDSGGDAASKLALGRRLLPLGTAAVTAAGVLGATRALERRKQRYRKPGGERHASTITGPVVAGVAHDINNLLVPVVGMAELMRSTLPPGAAAHHHVFAIHEAAGQAAALARKLVSYAMEERNREHVAVDLRRVVLDGARLLEGTVARRSRLRVSIPSDAVQVLGDPQDLLRVIWNLGSNALDAMPGGGQLRLELETTGAERGSSTTPPPEPRGASSRPVPEPDADPGLAVLRIVDTGPGIRPTTLRRLLIRPTFGSRGARRTGLGIASVRAMIREHGGEIVVSSQRRKGTTFTILLPVLRAASVRGAAEEGARVAPEPRDIQTGEEE